MATKSEFQSTMVNEFTNTYSLALPVKSVLKELAGYCYDALKYKGTGTAAEVEALEAPKNGDTYRIITTGGTLNGGALTVAVGDTVTYDEATDLWELFTIKYTP